MLNATSIRKQISSQQFYLPQLETSQDVIRIQSGDELQEYLEDNYNQSGINNTIILCRSNKRANIYNQQIRTRIRYVDEEIVNGDLLMVVKTITSG